MPTVSVIGAGFSGLSAAACLAQSGYDVTVFEKHETPGGRARQLIADGFTFDMGPSWYWMPDVFEKFYARFGKKAADFYELKRLDPSYRIFFSGTDTLDVPAGIDALYAMFEQRERGSSRYLREFLEAARFKYETGINNLVYKPGLSLTELFDKEVFKGFFRLQLLSPLSGTIRKHIKDPGLIHLLEFPALFLGATASQIPALYSLMNYADLCLGTWYPIGGMYKIIEAMYAIAREQGVKFSPGSEVSGFKFGTRGITSLTANGNEVNTDIVVASADYHHVEQQLLPKALRRYSDSYWERRKMAPSSILFYLGINKPLSGLLHHNLFFDEDFERHALDIYQEPRWPEKPLFYVCCPSKTDSTVAPAGCENVFILIPTASGLEDDETIREHYYNLVISRLETLTRQAIRSHVIFKKSYAHRDFVTDYHAFKGNAYGLANTLSQTANLKPSIVNKNVPNLFYTGQLTVPGPGVPPSIISGQVVAGEVMKRSN